MKDLFRNNSDVCVVWWNRTEQVILVALFNENNVLIRKSNMYPMDYIIVPGHATVKLLLDSAN